MKEWQLVEISHLIRICDYLKKWQLVEISYMIRICDLVLKPFEKWLSMIIFYPVSHSKLSFWYTRCCSSTSSSCKFHFCFMAYTHGWPRKVSTSCMPHSCSNICDCLFILDLLHIIFLSFSLTNLNLYSVEESHVKGT